TKAQRSRNQLIHRLLAGLGMFKTCPYFFLGSKSRISLGVPIVQKDSNSFLSQFSGWFPAAVPVVWAHKAWPCRDNSDGFCFSRFHSSHSFGNLSRIPHHR